MSFLASKQVFLNPVSAGADLQSRRGVLNAGRRQSNWQQILVFPCIENGGGGIPGFPRCQASLFLSCPRAERGGQFIMGLGGRTRAGGRPPKTVLSRRYGYYTQKHRWIVFRVPFFGKIRVLASIEFWKMIPLNFFYRFRHYHTEKETLTNNNEDKTEYLHMQVRIKNGHCIIYA